MLDKRYDFRIAEKKWQEYWETDDIFKFDISREGEIYSIDTPPPTVSGSLHIGHLFSYTQAEIIARFQRMQGRNVFYPFGFDDNGLPTERLVEREEGIRAGELPRSEFTEKCIVTTAKYVNEFRNLWKSLGFSVDWSLQYETISPRVQKISQKSFLELARKGKAYNKEMPVLWCTNCRTSIAQAELETADRESSFNWIPFYCGDTALQVATTRPELLYGCVCLFVHPDDDRFRTFIGQMARVPLYDYEIPILADPKVSMDKGSGVVMCATFGDSTDMEWYIEHKLPYRKVIEANGTISGDVPFIGGLAVSEARQKIIRLLDENGLLLRRECITHTVSTHERCGKDIEIIPSRQWYIDVLSSKQELFEAADKINWYPASMKIRYTSWVENLKWDWCISRQRYFGVPFPLWYCTDCGAVILADDAQLPVNPQEHRPLGRCSCGSETFIPEEAVMDTWATSSVTPMINSHWGEEDDISSRLLPMSMRTQAHEIIRTWAFYTIVKSLFHAGGIPWKDIMICGFVLAKKGEKVSKSKNNSVNSPAALIARNSADTLRYWTANARLGADTMFSEDELQVSKRFLTKLWNASRFALMHLEDFDGQCPEYIMPIDRWILERFGEVTLKAAESLGRYETGEARHEMDTFFWGDLCDNYLEIIKERLYRPDIHGEKERKSAQYALYNTLLETLKLYAIYVPHITEEIYQAFFRNREGERSIHLLRWKMDTGIKKKSSLLEFGNTIKNILAEVRRYKSEHNLSMKTPLDSIVISVPDEHLELLESTLADLKACTGASEITVPGGTGVSVDIFRNGGSPVQG